MCTSNIEKEIELVNMIIIAAVNHGGDGGGAYFNDAEFLNESIMDWLKFRGIDTQYTTTYELAKDKENISIVKR